MEKNYFKREFKSLLAMTRMKNNLLKRGFKIKSLIPGVYVLLESEDEIISLVKYC